MYKNTLRLPKIAGEIYAAKLQLRPVPSRLPPPFVQRAEGLSSPAQPAVASLWASQSAEQRAREARCAVMENPVESLHKEATCSICLEYFQDPVSIPCGHSFCRVCITQCWKERSTNFSCPQCREIALQRNFRPNRELGNVVEITKRLSARALKGAAGDGEAACEKHHEALKLFCSQEEALICYICRESRAHRSHAVFPIEEAAQDYKVGGRGGEGPLPGQPSSMPPFLTLGKRGQTIAAESFL